LAAHLAVIEDDYRRREWSAADARVAARRALGGVDQAKDPPRPAFVSVARRLRRDVPYALRGWARHPGFTIAAIVTVALGVGVSTAIFSVVSAVISVLRR
jgi:hypothetical protein